MASAQATPNVKSEEILVTPSLAQRWLEQNVYDRQRRLRPGHVDYLAHEMQEGRFLQLTQIAFAGANGNQKLVNGQHTLSAIVKSKMPQMLSVVWHGVQTDDEINRLYYRYDRQKSRSVDEMLNSLDMIHELGMTATAVRRLAAAAKVIMTGFHQGNRKSEVSLDDLALIMREYAKFGQTYFDLVRLAPSEMTMPLYRASTISVALITLRYSVEALGTQKVNDFWTGVAFDDGLRVGDPRKTLNRHLVSSTFAGGESPTGHLTKQAAICYVARCWNAWVKDETLKVVRLPAKLSEVQIECTPWSKNWTE